MSPRPLPQFPSGLLILVVSLAADTRRRAALEGRFRNEYPHFVFVEAFDFRCGVPPERESQRKRSGLTPAEMACTMSHIKALEVFLQSGARHALILEDDVIGSDVSIGRVRVATRHLSGLGFLLCGGQQGLRNNRYLFGDKPDDNGVSHVASWSRAFMARACAYLITRDTAQALLNRHGRLLIQADAWSFLLQGLDGIHYMNAFSHPVDLRDSHLEPQRNAVAGSVARRILRDGVWETAVRSASKAMLLVAGRWRGWSRLDVSGTGLPILDSNGNA